MRFFEVVKNSLGVPLRKVLPPPQKVLAAGLTTSLQNSVLGPFSADSANSAQKSFSLVQKAKGISEKSREPKDTVRISRFLHLTPGFLETNNVDAGHGSSMNDFPYPLKERRPLPVYRDMGFRNDLILDSTDSNLDMEGEKIGTPNGNRKLRLHFSWRSGGFFCRFEHVTRQLEILLFGITLSILAQLQFPERTRNW